MFIWCKNSAHTLLKNARPAQDDCAVLWLHAAKGGHACGQIFLRDVEDFTIESISVTDCGRDVTPAFYLQGYEVFNDGIPYPDRMDPFVPCAVKAHTAQGIWLVVASEADVAPGLRHFTVTVHTDKGDMTAAVHLRVYAVTMPAPADGALEHEYFFNTRLEGRYGAGYALYTAAWWDLMADHARAMADLRVNALYLHPAGFLPGEGTRRTGPTSWQLNFDRFEQVVNHFWKHGSFKRLTIAAPLESLTGNTVPSFDENGEPITLETRSAAGEAYIRTLLTGIGAYLERSGHLAHAVMHLADEPHETANWLWMRALVKEIIPELPVSEPIDMYQSALEMAEACDEFIPRLEVYEQGRDFFEKRQQAGKKVWCYSCCFPEEPWYLNKFIDLPTRYSRLIKWACAAQGITGFLHWGFNHWDAAPYGMQPNSRFKGDGYIVYPDVAAGTVRHSARGLATMEGIEEYELLQMAAQKAPAAAKALATGMARSFCDFEADPDKLDAARARLLTLCEGALNSPLE